MRARGGALFLVCAVAALTAAPAVATTKSNAVAKDKAEVRPGSFVAGFQLMGSHGYALSVSAFSHQQIQLSARKGQTVATYLTRGRASRKGIEADFGALGKIAVRFDGSPMPPAGGRKSAFTCEGRRAIRERGTFHGTIRFAGENGFTEVGADRARGRFQRSFRRVCRRASPRPEPKPSRSPRLPQRTRFQSDTLVVESKAGESDTGLFLSSTEFPDGSDKEWDFGLAVVVASRNERVGPVSISRSAFMIGDSSILRASEPGTYPIVATVRPPKPFTGTATYREDRGLPPTWAGSLGVRLPGAGTVPLTGEGFESSFCRASTEKALYACLRQFNPNTRTAQAT